MPIAQTTDVPTGRLTRTRQFNIGGSSYPIQTLISFAISGGKCTCSLIPDRAASIVETLKSLSASVTCSSVAMKDLKFKTH